MWTPPSCPTRRRCTRSFWRRGGRCWAAGRKTRRPIPSWSRRSCTARASCSPAPAHYLLLSLPFRLIITTNYDDLLERALIALKRHPIKVVRQEDVARTGQGDGVFVVKLHGDAAEPEGVVLARDDYDEFFQARP